MTKQPRGKVKEYGRGTYPKLRISIGKWYLEFGKEIEVYRTMGELTKAIKKHYD